MKVNRKIKITKPRYKGPAHNVLEELSPSKLNIPQESNKKSTTENKENYESVANITEIREFDVIDWKKVDRDIGENQPKSPDESSQSLFANPQTTNGSSENTVQNLKEYIFNKDLLAKELRKYIDDKVSDVVEIVREVKFGKTDNVNTSEELTHGLNDTIVQDLKKFINDKVSEGVENIKFELKNYVSRSNDQFTGIEITLENLESLIVSKKGADTRTYYMDPTVDTASDLLEEWKQHILPNLKSDKVLSSWLNNKGRTTYYRRKLIYEKIVLISSETQMSKELIADFLDKYLIVKKMTLVKLIDLIQKSRSNRDSMENKNHREIMEFIASLCSTN